MAEAKRIPSRGVWLRRGGGEADNDRRVLARRLDPHELAALGSWYWEGWGRDEQLPPEHAWRVWLICAGRGFGKTRAGAEWVRDVARHDGAARIALVGANLGEVRLTMVEGESGILAAAPGALAPEFEPSLRRLTWANGAQAFLYSAAEPDSLRGGQFSHASPSPLVNEALARVDALIQPVVLGEAATPPASPASGDSYLVGAGASGVWTGHVGAIATWSDTQWLFAPPREGARVHDAASGSLAVFGATDGWRRAAAPPLSTGGATQDAEARAAITAIVAGLHRLGIFSA